MNTVLCLNVQHGLDTSEYLRSNSQLSLLIGRAFPKGSTAVYTGRLGNYGHPNFGCAVSHLFLPKRVLWSSDYR